VDNDSSDLTGRTVAENVLDDDGKSIIKSGNKVTKNIAAKLTKLNQRKVKVSPFVSNAVIYFSADEEDEYAIAGQRTSG